MRTLELFSGTQSFSKAMRRGGHKTMTVDILPLFKPNVCVNILEWNYKIYKPGVFDVIWASPPCNEYSKAKTRGARNLPLADSLVRKAFEIIDYFKPKIWIVENVGTGLLVDRMNSIRPGLNQYFVDYCAYGALYRKRTVLWSNIKLHMGLCAGAGKCPGMKGNKHIHSVGNGNAEYNGGRNLSVWEKDAIPEGLMDYIVAACATAL